MTNRTTKTTRTMHSELPGRPSFRNSAMHAVAIVPLSIPPRDDDDDNNSVLPTTTTAATHSEKSFHHLLHSLQEFAIQGRMAHQRTTNKSNNNSTEGSSRKWYDESSEITLILPHSQLTRPGDWRYDSTPLKSHDWQSGCQRIRLFDGRPQYSRMAADRIGSINEKKEDVWKELEPHRSTSAVIGILSMKDCKDTRDLWSAEESLIQWTRTYASHDTNNGNDTQPSDILTRLFVFDSFEEHLQKKCNLNSTRIFNANQLVAFPPMLDMNNMNNSQMMVLHWNVVVNDLAVALFRNVERRIRENDLLGKSLVWNKQQQQQSSGASGGASSQHGEPPSSAASAMLQSSERTDSSVTTATDDTSASQTTTGTTDVESTAKDQGGFGMGGRLKNAFDNTRKAIANRQDSTSTAGGGGGGGGKSGTSSVSSSGGGGGTTPNNTTSNNRRKKSNKLVTPLDLDAGTNDVMSSISPRDMEALKRRDLGRREKRSADLSLLAGSPIDAYERYTRAAELTRHSHDPLWYASALEGCACAFVAMADAGGHGVDEYLENNFQLPEEIMALAIAQGVAAGADLGDGRGKTMTVDRTKTTLPQAVTALVEEAMSVLCRHEKLAPLHAGLLLKLAEYVQEEEEGHLRCRWGEGEYCYGGDLNSMTGDYTPPRWERTSVSKLDLRGTEVRDMLALDSIERGRKFTELLHRAVSVGGLDDRSRADVAAACARACLVGTKV